jgi:MbtH protein
MQDRDQLATTATVNEPPAEMHFVVVNHQEQYSIWPSYKDIPAGWRAIGDPRSKEECLAYISQIWTDMRPLSLRRERDDGPST